MNDSSIFGGYDSHSLVAFEDLLTILAERPLVHRQRSPLHFIAERSYKIDHPLVCSPY